MRNSPGGTGSVRGVLDLVSLVQQPLVIIPPRSLRVKLRVEVRGRDLGLLGGEEDSLVHQWVVLQV